MSQGLKLEIVADKFNRMLAELAAIDTRVEFATVVKSEATAVIRTAMGRTKAAKATSIRNDWKTKEWTTFGGKRYRFAVWRLPDNMWQGIQEKRKTGLQTKLNARGLSKQSWLHVARSFGATIAAPAYVETANYKGRQYPVDGVSTERGGGTDYALTILNSSPIVQAAGGERALLIAMNGRANYFLRNIEHHAFKTLESRAKKYPGIWTAPVPPPAEG